MTPRVLVFFPGNPFAAANGAHRRCLEVFDALRELGCRTRLLGSELTTDEPWTESPPAILERYGVERVEVHRPTRGERAVRSAGRAAYRVLAPFLDRVAVDPDERIIRDGLMAPAGLRRAFAASVAAWDPDVLFMNYAVYDALVDHPANAHRRRVIDSIDLVGLAMRYRRALGRFFPDGPSPDPPDEALREDFFDRFQPSSGPEPEFAIYDRYDHTLAISRREADAIARNTTRTVVSFAPMTANPVPLANEYAGPPVFAAGMNPFNVQGYHYLTRRVLPAASAAAPGLEVLVTGRVCDRLPPAPGVRLEGFVSDLTDFFRRAAFAITPVFGGTGQQVKIVEAMAHGLPVVALRAAAEASPLVHGMNGLVADTADEFADHAARLWADRGLCRRLGAAARDTVAAEYRPDRLVQVLASAVLEARTGK
jgi:glycosyltransferase involved in cell wall biosynthesis